MALLCLLFSLFSVTTTVLGAYTTGATLYCLPLNSLTTQSFSTPTLSVFNCATTCGGYALAGYYYNSANGSPNCACSNNFGATQLNNTLCSNRHLLNPSITTCSSYTQLGCGDGNGQYATVWIQGDAEFGMAILHGLKSSFYGSYLLGQSMVQTSTAPPGWAPFAANTVRQMSGTVPTWQTAYGSTYSSPSYMNRQDGTNYAVASCLGYSSWYAVVTAAPAVGTNGITSFYCLTEVQAKPFYNPNSINYLFIGPGIYTLKRNISFGYSNAGTSADCTWDFFSQSGACVSGNAYEDVNFWMSPSNTQSTYTLSDRSLLDTIGCSNTMPPYLTQCSGSYSWAKTTSYAQSWSLAVKGGFKAGAFGTEVSWEVAVGLGGTATSSTTNAHTLQYSESIAAGEIALFYVYSQRTKTTTVVNYNVYVGGQVYVEGSKIPVAMLNMHNFAFPLRVSLQERSDSVVISRSWTSIDYGVVSYTSPLVTAPSPDVPANF